jgi:predicted ATPase
MLLQDILDRLDVASTLRSTSPLAHPRQASLQASLDWSYGLLEPDECALLPRLSVFAGGWTLDTLAEVCADRADEIDPVEIVLRLVDRSLVQPPQPTDGGPARYRMLEPIRQYAKRLLDRDGNADHWRRRHATHFAELAEHAAPGLRGAQQLHSTARLDAELDNLRAALAWSSAPCRSDSDQELARRMAGALSRWRHLTARDRGARDSLEAFVETHRGEAHTHTAGRGEKCA